jgi:hypothetical protein
MSSAVDHSRLDALLQHPALWRGRGAAPQAGFPTGFDALDAVLPGGGWPRRGLVEILVAGHGCGELALFTPLIQRLTQAENQRWCAFVAPPFEPFAPAWLAQGARLDRLLILRPPQPFSAACASIQLWTLEQSLLCGACAMSFAWPDALQLTQLRRLALATEHGASLGVLIRPLRAAAQSTAAVLRIALTRTATHLHLQLIKGRGLTPCAVKLPLP